MRDIDFKNFSYVWQEPKYWPDRLQWLRASGAEIQVEDGRWRLPGTEDGPMFAGLMLESVDYGDVTGDGKDEALVVLRYDSGGTQYHYYVYLLTSESGRVKLLARFRSGDRASFGLYRVAIEKGSLVVELYDPDSRVGDCCSTRFHRTRYKWREDHFDPSGPVETGKPKTTSRRPANVFGLQQLQ